MFAAFLSLMHPRIRAWFYPPIFPKIEYDAFYTIDIQKKSKFKSIQYFQDNTTPLYAASQKGHRDVVQTLLEAGADLNITRSDVSDVDVQIWPRR